MSRTLRGVNSPLTAKLRKREDASRASQIVKEEKKASPKTTKTVKVKAASSSDSKATKSKIEDVKTSAVKE